jgi:hypothetical protein
MKTMIISAVLLTGLISCNSSKNENACCKADSLAANTDSVLVDTTKTNIELDTTLKPAPLLDLDTVR